MNGGTRIGMGLALCLLFGIGCGRLTTSMNEEREANYVSGKNRLYSHDYRAAREAFEKSLLTIPDSASAHLELGLLHQKHFDNSARAIYHFQKMLEHRPDHPLAERIVEQIHACKLALATEVTLPPVNRRVEAEIKRLINENQSLKNRLSQLRGEMSKLKTSLAARIPISNNSKISQSSYNSYNSQSSNNSNNSYNSRISQTSKRRSSDPNEDGRNHQQRSILSSQNSTERLHLKHVLKSGETFYSLARRYGIDFREIQKVNPDSRPTALQIGQVVNIPISQTASIR